MAAAEAAAQRLEQKIIQEKMRNEQADIDAERALVEDDRLATQDIYRMMRQSGLMAGKPIPNSYNVNIYSPRS